MSAPQVYKNLVVKDKSTQKQVDEWVAEYRAIVNKYDAVTQKNRIYRKENATSEDALFPKNDPVLWGDVQRLVALQKQIYAMQRDKYVITSLVGNTRVFDRNHDASCGEFEVIRAKCSLWFDALCGRNIKLFLGSEVFDSDTQFRVGG